MLNSAFKNFAWLIIGAILIAAPLYFGGVIPGFIFTVSTILFLFSLICFVFFGKKNSLYAPSGLILGLIILITALFASSFWSVYKRASCEEIVYSWALICFFLIIIFCVNGLDKWKRLLLILFISATIVAFWGLFAWFLDVQRAWGLKVSVQLHGAHLPFVNRNHFAGFLALVFPFGFILSLREKNLWVRIVSIVSLILIFLGIVFSLSRGVWISFIVEIFIMGWLWISKSKRIFTKKSFLLIGIAFVVIVFLFIKIGVDPVLIRVESSLTKESQWKGLDGRHAIWNSTWNMFKEKPLTGFGLGTFGWIFPHFRLPGFNGHAWFAHNDYLQMLAEGGPILFGSFIFLVVVSFFYMRRGFLFSKRKLKKEFYLASIGSLSAFCVMLIFDFQSHIFACTLVLVAIIGAAVRNSKNALKFKKVPRLLLVGIFPMLFLGMQLMLSNVFYQIGMRKLDSNNFDKAIESFSLARDIDPSNAEIDYEIAKTFTYKTRYGLQKYYMFLPAFRGYLQAARKFPLGALYWMNAGMILDSAWSLSQIPLSGKKMQPVLLDIKKEERLYNIKSPQFPEKAEFYFKKALRIDPFNSYFHDVIAIYYLRLGKIENVKKHVLIAITCLPDIGRHSFFKPYLGSKTFRGIVEQGLIGALKNSYKKANIYSQLLVLYLMEKKLDKAKECLRHLKEYSFWYNNPSLLLKESEIDIIEQNYKNAFKLMEFYLIKEGWKTKSINNVLKIFNVAKKSNQKKLFIKSITAKWGKKHPYLYLVKAEILFREKNLKEAIEYFKKYLKYNPDDGKAYMNLGLAYLAINDGLFAEENFRHAIDRGVSKPDVYIYLVRSLLMQQETDQAIFELEMAYRQFPESIKIAKLLASLYEKKKAFGKAAKVLSDICKKYSKNIFLNLSLCRDYYLNGDLTKAYNCYRMLMEKFPEQKQIKEEFQKLKF